MPPEKIKIMEENKMAKLTTAEFIEAIKELSVLEFSYSTALSGRAPTANR